MTGGLDLSRAYPPADRGTIVIWGFMASQPFGGMTWQALHYLVGLRQLGFDVWYVEDSDRVVLDPVRFWPTLDYEPNVAHLDLFMKSVGLGDRWVFRPPEVWDLCLGAADDMDGLARIHREADAVINLCGSQELRPDHEDLRCLIYLQTDPTADQVRVAKGDAEKIAELDTYDHLFTYGENIGQEGCLIPASRYEWKTTRPPVILDWWQGDLPQREPAGLSTITNWNKFPSKDLVWEGQSWSWNKQDEIRRFIDLPANSALPLELAIGGIDEHDQAMLRSHGWQLIPATDLGNPHDYRSFILSSLGELTVAKQQYVAPRTGWFSDRSVCYLAAGRPVITQDTDFGRNIPTGEGLFAFKNEDQALTGIEAVASDPARHSAAARDLAAEYFDGGRVLTEMLIAAGLMS